MWFETTSFLSTKTDGDDTVVAGLTGTPKFLIFDSIYHTATDAVTDGLNMIFGFASALDAEAGGSVASDHGAGTSNAARGTNNVECLYIVNASGTVILRGNIKSFDANGFTIQWTTYVAGIYIHVTIVGGDEVAANVVTFNVDNTKTAGQTQDVAHGLTAIPTGMMVLTSWLVNDITIDARAWLALGFSDGINNGVCTLYSADGAGTSDTQRGELADNCLGLVFGSYLQRMYISGVDATNVEFTFTDNALAAYRVHMLVFTGISCEVGSDLAHNAAEAHEHSLTGSFTPKGLLMASISNAASASVEDHAILSFGAGASASDRRCIGVTDEDGLSVATDAGRISDTAAILQMLDENTAITDEIDLVGFGAGTFTNDYSIGSAFQFIFMALGDKAGHPWFYRRNQ